MANRDWEIHEIEAGTASRFFVCGQNHCDPDSPGRSFYWHVESVADSRFFAGPKLVISDKVRALLNVAGQIGSGK